MAIAPSDAGWKREHDDEILLTGSWTLLLDAHRRRRLARELGELDVPRHYNWNLKRVKALDSAGARLLWDVWDHQLPAHLDVHADHQHWFKWVADTPATEPPARHPWQGVADRIYQGIAGFVRGVGGLLLLMGQLLLDIGYCIRHPRMIPWKEMSATVYQLGATSMPLLGIVGFAIGVVMTIQIGMTLEHFHAPMMVIPMLGLAVLRELGPVIAGLILAGRYGSAVTAGIGSMHLTGEYGALRAFGSSPSLRLALPRVAAAIVTVPLLVVWTDLVELVGGAVTAEGFLGVSHRVFMQELPYKVQIVNFWMGLGKGGLFGLTIALVGCYFGMSASPSTASLRRNTTLSVVTSLTLILVLDATSGALLTHIGLM